MTSESNRKKGVSDMREHPKATVEYPSKSEKKRACGHEARPGQSEAAKSARPAAGRRFQFHMKLVESEGATGAWQIEGYASTRDLDRTGEIVEPGAFAESLTEFMANPVLTYMHDWSNPIGKVIDARIDEVGLFIRAEISKTAEKVWKLIREGILRAFSIGYEVVEEKVVDGANHILRLRLYEVAVVSIPANRRALFSVAKGLEQGTDLVRQVAADGEIRNAGMPGSVGYPPDDAVNETNTADVGATRRVARDEEEAISNDVLEEVREALKAVLELLG
jgi:HK97 family phage prohead protease